MSIKAADVSRAKDDIHPGRELGYGTNHPTYMTALKALEEATNAYEAKIEGIMAGLEALVNHDRRVARFH